MSNWAAPSRLRAALSWMVSSSLFCGEEKFIHAACTVGVLLTLSGRESIQSSDKSFTPDAPEVLRATQTICKTEGAQ